MVAQLLPCCGVVAQLLRLSRRVVGTQPQPTEGGLERGGGCARAEAMRRSRLGGASSEAESVLASRGLGGRPSSESEAAPRPLEPRRGRTVVLGQGPSAYSGRPHWDRTWAELFDCDLHYLGVS